MVVIGAKKNRQRSDLNALGHHHRTTVASCWTELQHIQDCLGVSLSTVRRRLPGNARSLYLQDYPPLEKATVGRRESEYFASHDFSARDSESELARMTNRLYWFFKNSNNKLPNLRFDDDEWRENVEC